MELHQLPALTGEVQLPSHGYKIGHNVHVAPHQSTPGQAQDRGAEKSTWSASVLLRQLKATAAYHTVVPTDPPRHAGSMMLIGPQGENRKAPKPLTDNPLFLS